MIPFLFVAPLLSDVVLQHAVPWATEILSTALVGTIYAAALLFLMHPQLRFNLALSSMRDLILLTLVAMAGAALVASAHVGLMIAAAHMPATDFPVGTLRYWVGDVIGIMVVTPFALIALTRRHGPRISVETALQMAAILAALAVVFGYSEAQQFQLFYVLFLPIVWMAVRTGSEGVSVGILITQIGLIMGVQLLPSGAHDFTAYQALMLVLAMTGLVAGELVTERRRTEAELRLHQESLARLSRLGTMGELAAAVAHELNQPLMAAGTYARLVDDAMGSGNTAAAAVAETAKKVVAQVERAAEVVRHISRDTVLWLTPKTSAMLSWLAPPCSAHKSGSDPHTLSVGNCSSAAPRPPGRGKTYASLQVLAKPDQNIGPVRDANVVQFPRQSSSFKFCGRHGLLRLE
jgi:integral membrane sensor domain MASE1